MIISFNISEEQLKRVEQLARHRRMTTGENANRSSEVGRAIDALFLAECLSEKTDDVNEIAAAEPVTA